MIGDRDRVLEATDLVALIGEHVRLERKGREHLGLCPFHDDRRPSMAVVTHKGTPFFKCFACGAAGNAIDFMMRYHRLEFPEALRQLAERSGITLTARRGDATAEHADRRADLIRANEVAARAFRRMLGGEQEGVNAREMLDRRQVGEEMRERFGLGAAPPSWDRLASGLEAWSRGGEAEGRLPMDVFEEAGLIQRNRHGEWIDRFRNRLVFPIRNEMGRAIAFGARQLDPEDQPKYLNSPESAVFDKSATLYGLDLAKQAIIRSKTAVVVEGYLDVIACHAAGFENVVATLGTALTAGHARRLAHKAEEVVLLFDGDAAGERAADRAIEVFFAGTLDVRIGALPGGLDPDDLLKTPDGPAAFEHAVEHAVDALDHLLRRFARAWASTEGLSGRQRQLEELLTRLARLGFHRMASLRRSLVLDRLAGATGLSTSDLLAAMPTEPRRESASAEQVEVKPASIARESTTAIDPPTPARRSAERTLASVLMSWPDLGEHRPEVLEIECRDPLAARVLDWVRRRRDAARARERGPDVVDLVTDTPESERAELDALMALADRRPSLDGDLHEQLASAVDDLAALERRAAVDAELRTTTAPRDAEELSRRLERLRDGGGRAAAIGRLSGSPRPA
ncbi:MAG: DNA primase [Phycisphaerales bacterium]